ncbi:MAG: MBL fold metallo-hydrolase [Pseudomonadota bacterium]
MSDSSDETEMEVTIWGARGTLPAPGPQFACAGGNTNCTEVSIGDHTIIFDAGTGIRELGSKLVAKGTTQNVHVLLTHAHYDHVEGLPFFAPFFMAGSSVDVYCGALDGSTGTEDTVKSLMRRPYFPVGPSVFVADVKYLNVGENEGFELADGIKVSTIPLNHPGGATAYRVDWNDKSFACVTDTEHVVGKPDESIIEMIDGVDAFVYDCSLTDEEFPDFAGYGHSTFEEALRLQKHANAGALIACHHMPFRVDDELDQVEQELKSQLDTNMIGREGHTLVI